ncbi:MAG TPA: methyltransferase domain-containing protein [Dehalococcoidia bacterium]|nr:methyltransferase domain-containing protein [Dehalococcoidia bacterium]
MRLTDAIPAALHGWWQGLPRVAAEDSAAFLLPGMLPLRHQDRVLTLGAGSAAIAALLDSRVPMVQPPVSVGERAGMEDIQAVGGRLPFPPSHFTVLICGHQIRRWTDAELAAFLTEAWRVLTHNGVLVLWEVAPSRSARVNAIWKRLLGYGGRTVRLRTFAEVGHLGRAAGFAWIQTLALRPFLWPPGPRLSLLLRKEYYDEDTLDLRDGETPD